MGGSPHLADWAARHAFEAETSTPAPRHGDCIARRIAVEFEYPVRFTHHCLEPSNPSLRLAVSRRELQRYASAHESAIELAGPPMIVPGGEDAKNDPAHLGGELTVTLLSDVGVGLEVHVMDEKSVVLAVDDLRRRAGR
jgi:3-dehydroquinate synthase